MKKILLMLLIVVFASSVYGVFNDPFAVYNFNQTGASELIDQVGALDSTGHTITAKGVAGINNFAWDFEASATADIINMPPSLMDNRNPWAWIGWIKPESLGTDPAIIYAETEAPQDQSRYLLDTAISIFIQLHTDGDTQTATITQSWELGDWTMLGYTYDGSRLCSFLNATIYTCTAIAGDIDIDLGTFDFGSSSRVGTNFYDGLMDEFYFYDHNLSEADIASLYNGGAGNFYPFTVPPTTPTASFLTPPTPVSPAYNNTLGQNITVQSSFSGNATIFFGNATNPVDLVATTITNETDWIINSTIVTREQTYFYKGSASEDGGSGINTTIRSFTYDVTPPNYTVLQTLSSRVLIVNLSEYINATDNLTGVKNCNLNFTLLETGNSQVVNCTNTVAFANAGFYNISLYIEDRAGNTLEASEDFLIDPLNYLYWSNNATGDPLINASILIKYPSGTELNLNTSLEGRVNFSSIVSSTIELGDYNFTLLSTQGFITPITFSDNINSSEIPFNNSYSISQASISINIYDRETSLLLTENATVQVPGLFNVETDNGTVFIVNASIVSGSYQIIVSADSYITEKQSFTYTNQEEINLDIYMVNATSTAIGNVILVVYDDFYNFIVGANTKLLEFDTATSSFIEVSQCETNSNGECIFSVELNIKFYILQASKEIGGLLFEAQSTTNGELIKETNTIIELHLQTTERFEVDELFNLQIVTTNTTLVGNTSYLTATFSDSSNIDHTVCISYSIRQGTSENELTSTCATGSAGIINVVGGFILDRDFTYIAKVYVDTGTQKDVYDSYVYASLESSFKSEFGLYAEPIILLSFILLLGISLYLKNISIFAYGTMPLSLFTLFLIPTLLGGITVSFIIILCFIIIYLSKRKKEAF